MNNNDKIIEFKPKKEKHINIKRKKAKVNSDKEIKTFNNEKLSNDIKEEGNLRYGIYKQPLKDGLLAWRIDGLYKKDEFKTKNSLKLRKEPPILVLEDDAGNKVNFVLTKTASKDLADSLKILNDAYNGKPNKRKMKIKDIKNITKNWKEWPIDTVMISIATISLIIVLILG